MTQDRHQDALSRPFVGFRTYADDSLRDGDFEAYDDDLEDPRGRDAFVGRGATVDERPTDKRAGWNGLLITLLVSAGLAAAFAVYWRGHSAATRTPVAAMARASEPGPQAPDPSRLQVEIAANATAPPPLPPPRADAARLEVLAPLVSAPTALNATATERSAQTRRDPIEPPASRGSVPVAPLPDARAAEVLPPPVAEETRPAPSRVGAAGLECRTARLLSQQIVCDDPGLMAAERRMRRAYAAAQAAGVPDDELRRDQRDWLEAREDAARDSKQAVEEIYHQRIQDLEALADQGPR